MPPSQPLTSRPQGFSRPHAGVDHSQVSRVLCEFPVLENLTKSTQTLATYAEEGWTQEEIAESEGISQDAISLILREFPNLEKLVKPNQTLATYAEEGWTPPIYNVWKVQTSNVGHVTPLGEQITNFVRGYKISNLSNPLLCNPHRFCYFQVGYARGKG